MKKTIILLTLLCLLLASCGEQAKPAESSAPEAESSETASESLGQEEELLALQAELKEANQDLAEANRRISTLEAQIDSLVARLERLEPLKLEDLQQEAFRLTAELEKVTAELEEQTQLAASLQAEVTRLEANLGGSQPSLILRSIPIAIDYPSNWHRLLLVQDENWRITLYLRYPDGETVEIAPIASNDGYIVPSPDGKHIAYNNYSWEFNTPIYLYDLETKETRTLPTSLPEDETPSAMCWLDSRYLLFVCQFDHGTIVQGGDVYYYDIETDKHGKIIETDDPGMLQINDFHRYDDFMILTATQLEEEYLDPIDDKYFTVSYEQIYDLIETGTLLTLKSEDEI